jgi:hypothetical protein
MKSFLTSKATFLNFADHIIVLEAGGSMTYSDTVENWKKDHGAPPTLEDPEPTKEGVKVGCGTQASEEPLPSESNDIDISKDPKRRSGDSADWWYYLRHIGFAPLAWVVLFSVTHLLCANFPRMDSPNTVVLANHLQRSGSRSPPIKLAQTQMPPCSLEYTRQSVSRLMLH